MRILRPVVDVATNPLAMRRPNRRAGEMLACQLLAPAFLGASEDPGAPTSCAAREFGPGFAPVLCGYAVRAVADPGLALLAMRQPRGRALIGEALGCLDKGGRRC